MYIIANCISTNISRKTYIPFTSQAWVNVDFFSTVMGPEGALSKAAKQQRPLSHRHSSLPLPLVALSQAKQNQPGGAAGCRPFKSRGKGRDDVRVSVEGGREEPGSEKGPQHLRRGQLSPTGHRRAQLTQPLHIGKSWPMQSRTSGFPGGGKRERRLGKTIPAPPSRVKRTSAHP